MGKRYLKATLMILVFFIAAGCDNTSEALNVDADQTAGIEIEVTKEPEEEPPSPSPIGKWDKLFTQEEKVFVAKDYSKMTYSSNDLYIEVTRYNIKSIPLRYHTVHIYVRNGQQFLAGYPEGKVPQINAGKRRQLTAIARKYSAVIAINGDFFVDAKNNATGVVIREGNILREDQKADTLAFMPDGSLKVFAPKEITGKQLLDMGVTMTHSFGPILIRDGVTNDTLDKHRLRAKNPRTGIGQIEEDHYIIIIAEGRRAGVSEGVSLSRFAKLFEAEGAYVAYNLDGGVSTNMSFLGNPICFLDLSEDVLHNDGRSLPDMIYIGTSEKCAKAGDAILRYGKDK